MLYNKERLKAAKTLDEYVAILEMMLLENPHDIETKKLLVQSCIVVGEILVDKEDLSHDHPVTITLNSAQKWLNHPTQDNYSKFVSNSTNSYPYGPGDGCYSVLPNDINHNLQGAGCITGAGTISLSLNSFNDDIKQKVLHSLVELV